MKPVRKETWEVYGITHLNRDGDVVEANLFRFK